MKEKMRNTIRRVLSVFAALVMVLGVMGANVTPVMADNEATVTGSLVVTTQGADHSITITPPNDLSATDTTTYTIYRIFNASSNGTNVSYTAISDSEIPSGGLVADDGLSKFDKDSGGNILYYTRTTSSGDWVQDTTGTATLSSSMIKKLSDSTSSFVNVGTVTITGSSPATVSVGSYGYYYVTSTTGSVVSVDTTNKHVNINDKNKVPEIDKKVTGGDATTPTDNNTADVGDDLTYTVTIKAKKGAKSYVFTDTLSTGLTLGNKTDLSILGDNNTLTEKTGQSATGQYTVNTFTENTKGNGSTQNIKITFDQTYLDTLTSGLNNTDSKDIVITYKAKVNNEALEKDTVNNNANLSYGDKPNTIQDDVTTKLFGFNLQKVDATDNTPLNNVQFVLQKTENGETAYYYERTGENSVWSNTAPTRGGDGTYTGAVSTTANGGKVSFNGIKAGTYTLSEVKTQDGYNLLNQAITITIAADGKITAEGAATITDADNKTATNSLAKADEATNTYVLTVQNHKGSLLPSTGGIGTTIFYVIGGVIVAGAIVLLIARRRKNA